MFGVEGSISSSRPGRTTGFKAVARTRTRCWSGCGLGSGAEALSLRLFSSPPRAVEYCQAFIVEGRVLVDIVVSQVVSLSLCFLLSG